MNEISNDVIKHCQALASLTRHYNDKIISFTIIRGKTDILLFGSPSDELLSKCRNIAKEELGGVTMKYTAEYAQDIELHWFEDKPLEDRV